MDKETKRRLLNFIEENKNLIGDNKWEKIYDEAGTVLYDYQVGEFTQLLLELKCNFLNYMSLIPENFLCDVEDIESFIIPDHINRLKIYSFFRCTNIKSITIPKSVATIEKYSFLNCTSLRDVYYKGSKEDWERIVVGYGNHSLLEANIHFEG